MTAHVRLFVCRLVGRSVIISLDTYTSILLSEHLLRGGLVDKPGKSRDLYHTCYALRSENK